MYIYCIHLSLSEMPSNQGHMYIYHEQIKKSPFLQANSWNFELILTLDIEM